MTTNNYFNRWCKPVAEKLKKLEPPTEALTPCAISFMHNKLPLHDPKTFNVCRFFDTTYRHDYSKDNAPLGVSGVTFAWMMIAVQLRHYNPCFLGTKTGPYALKWSL